LILTARPMPEREPPEERCTNHGLPRAWSRQRTFSTPDLPNSGSTPADPSYNCEDELRRLGWLIGRLVVGGSGRDSSYDRLPVGMP